MEVLQLENMLKFAKCITVKKWVTFRKNVLQLEKYSTVRKMC